MDCLEQARMLYGKRHQHGGAVSLEEHLSISTAISKLIHTCLLQQGGSACFRYLPFPHVIQRTVNANRFHGERAAMAFLTLEKYLLQLAQQPWKREFWVLKTYGGYFCSKVRAHLEGAEEILQLVGYVPDESATSWQCLILHEAPDIQVALNVAFDCQVASLECQYIGEYHSKMKCIGLDLSDAMNVLLSGAPNDPLVGFSLPGVLGRTSSLGNGVHMSVSHKPSSVQPDLFPSVQGQGAGRSHTVLASGGMGMGVVTGVKAKHQVIGVQPSHHASVGGNTHQVIGVSATHRTKGVNSFQPPGITSGTNSAEFEVSPAATTYRGTGVAPGTGNSVHHVAGVTATHAADPSSRLADAHLLPQPIIPSLSASSPYTLLQPQSELLFPRATESHPVGLGLTTHLPPQHPSSQLAEISGRPSYVASHPPSIASHPPGSRGSYASSAYALSSGYGSGSASVMSGGSSSSTGSTSHCSATMSSSNLDYVNLQQIRSGDPVDPSPRPPRPPRQSHKPQFSFIEEVEMGYGALFPEATHEEHLRESLRNLQVVEPDKMQQRPLRKNISSPVVSHHDDQVTRNPEAGGSYDDWRWLQGETDKGVLSSGKMVMESGGTRYLPASGIVQPSVQPAAGLRSTSSYPAMAGATMMSTDAMLTNMDVPHQGLVADPLPHQPHPQGYVSWTMASSSSATRPLSPSVPFMGKALIPQDVSTLRAGTPSHPVYYPPGCEEATYSSTNIMKGPPLHHNPNSTFFQKTARWEDRGPVTPRLQVMPSPLAAYNNLDKTCQSKVLNIGQESSRTGSDIWEKDSILDKVDGRGRADGLGKMAFSANLVGASGRAGHTSCAASGMRSSWRCGGCLKKNWMRDMVCATCGRSRGEPEPMFGVAGESKRVCPSCTFENPPGCRSCEVCEVLLPQDVHTYV